MLRIDLLFVIACLIFSRLSISAQEQIHVIPFLELYKVIFVKATVDGQNGYFIIDTGVPDLILNKKYFQGYDSREKLTGVNNYWTKVQFKKVRLQLGIIDQETEARVTNLQAIEEGRAFPIHGLLGVNLFKDHEIVINYFDKKIHLYPLDRRGERLLDNDPYLAPTETLEFYLRDHLPCIQGKIGKIRLHLALDTGASVNLLDPISLKKLRPYLTNIRQAKVVGIDGVSQAVSTAKLSSLQVGVLHCADMETYFYLPDEFQNEWTGHLDGLLGYEFLHQFRTTINFRKREIRLWDKAALEQEMLTKKN
jgi:hypothetical protein